MRLGLIGLGRIGAFHAQTLTDLPVVDSLAVTDAVPAVAAEVADRLGAEPAGTPTALLAAGVDGVVVAAATDAHPSLILAAVSAGLPVFCEKLVARTMAEGVEVQRRVEAAGVPVHIGYQRHFDAAFQAARAAAASGELGWLHTVRATTLDPAPPPPAYVAVSGGILRDCSVHDFDIIRWVTGREVVEVYATGGNRGDELFARAGDVDTSAAVLTWTTTPWRPAGSPRPAPRPCSSTDRYGWKGYAHDNQAARRGQDRRRPHLLGRVRGARLGLPARSRPGSGRDARGRPDRDRVRSRRVPARPARRHDPGP
jgi:predicted dehydrogenase